MLLPTTLITRYFLRTMTANSATSEKLRTAVSHQPIRGVT
jgi:hypothetical protein